MIVAPISEMRRFRFWFHPSQGGNTRYWISDYSDLSCERDGAKIYKNLRHYTAEGIRTVRLHRETSCTAGILKSSGGIYCA